MSEIEKRQKQTMQNYFVEQVGLALEGMSGAVSTQEAKRLTYNLVTAAQEAVEKSKTSNRPFNWNPQNIHNFLTQVIMHVSAGLDAVNDEVYAFPYSQEMSVQPSYRGYRKMIKEHAVGKKIIDLQCYAVREGEEFNVEYRALDHKWEYKSKPFNEAPILGYVTVLIYEDGTSQVMEHTLEDIRKRRFAGTSGNSPAWKNWEVEMSKAKAIKRHARTVDIRLKKEVQEFLDNIEQAEVKEIENKQTMIELDEPEGVVRRVDKIKIGNHEYGTIKDKHGVEHQVARWVGDEGEEVGEPAEADDEEDRHDESDLDESWLV